MEDTEDRNVDECWNEMVGYIKNAAKEILGESKGKRVIDKDTYMVVSSSTKCNERKGVEI